MPPTKIYFQLPQPSMRFVWSFSGSFSHHRHSEDGTDMSIEKANACICMGRCSLTCVCRAHDLVWQGIMLALPQEPCGCMSTEPPERWDSVAGTNWTVTIVLWIFWIGTGIYTATSHGKEKRCCLPTLLCLNVSYLLFCGDILTSLHICLLTELLCFVIVSTLVT